MTHLCYTLEEAAGKLKLTETVLVRLSQYFKMPRAAYEESGYLSFKGDLAFTELDINFFAQVKERLLMGESLDVIKRQVESVGQLPQPQAINTPAANLAAASSRESTLPPSAPTDLPVSMAPLRDIQDRQPYEKAAEASFERYKSIHRTGLGRVFESMLKEVGATQAADKVDKKLEKTPELRPIRPKTLNASQPSSKTPDDKEIKSALDRLSPFRRAETEMSRGEVPSSAEKPTSSPVQPSQSSGEGSWDQLLKQAMSQPRVMNSHLKSAAALLREKAISQDPHSEKLNR